MDEVSVKLGLDESALGRGLREAEHHVQEFAHSAKEQFGDVFRELAGPITSIGTVAGIERIFGKVEELHRVADATGLTTEAFQRLAYVARGAGVASEQMEKSMEFLSKTIGEAAEGGKGAVEVFDKWHIAIKGANGEVRETGDILNDISDKMAGLKSPAERAAMAMDTLGKSGAKMVGVLADGSKTLHARGAGAMIIDDDDIAEIDKMKDRVEVTGNALTVLGSKFVGVILKIFDALDERAGKGVALVSTAIAQRQMGAGMNWDQKAADQQNDVDTLNKIAEMKVASQKRMADNAAKDAFNAGIPHPLEQQNDREDKKAMFGAPHVDTEQEKLFKQQGYKPWTVTQKPWTLLPPPVIGDHPYGQGGAHDQMVEHLKGIHEHLKDGTIKTNIQMGE